MSILEYVIPHYNSLYMLGISDNLLIHVAQNIPLFLH